ncbi:MAG TPA: PEGA domain-containing protein [Kofleriaceae bacterium]|nr:PEGA domain-containing protein [Kofleriaceae bacterium]
MASVYAQDAGAAAEAAFDRGRQLMNDGKYADACAAFQQSWKLDPQIGTRYNIGVCSEKQGKLTTAWAAFREVAQRDTNEGRRKDAARRADALAPRLTKLLVNAATSPSGFSVKVNGNDVTNLLGIETPVDPGDYEVVATAPGFKEWSAKVSATGEGLTVTVAIPPLDRPQPIAPGTPLHSEPGKETTTIAHIEAHDETPAAPSRSNRKMIGEIVGGGGLALVAGGVIAGVMASGKWSDAKNVCNGMTTCATDGLTAQANALGDQARARANVATGLFAVGAIAIGVGATLWLTAPSESSHGVAIAPAVGPDGASVTIGGHF